MNATLSSRDVLTGEENAVLARLLQKLYSSSPESTVAIETEGIPVMSVVLNRRPYEFHDMNDDTPEARIIRRSLEAAGEFVHVASFEIDDPRG